MPRRHYLTLGLLIVAASQSATADDRLELIDGRTIDASIRSIGDGGEVVGDQLEADVNIADLRTIVRSSEPQTPGGGIVVDLSGGGRLRAKAITLADEKCQIDWGREGKLELPIDAVRAIRFGIQAPVPAFQSAIEKPTAGYDRLFVNDGERVQRIPGLIDSVTNDIVVFLRDDNEVRLPLSRVYGIVLAEVGGANVDGARCKVTLDDGSVIPGAIAQLSDGVLTLRLSRNVDLSLAWDAVARIDVQSPRMTYLSDMTPAEVMEQSIVAISRPWQRDVGVTGGILKLNFTADESTRTVEFNKGIGCHSRWRVTYEIDGDYDTLLATVGIDPTTGGRGDCMVSVLGDGKQLYSQRVTGRDKDPHQIRLDLSGVRRLTLAVEPGQDLDLADHVNWCDARLIRK